jgi:hypothetical protein
MRKKCLVAAASVAIVFGSAMTYRLVTGDCPLHCLFQHIHGKPAAAQSVN